jgi:hypothetical protein
MKKLGILFMLCTQQLLGQDTIVISGTCFYDANNNCQKEVNEPGISNIIFKDQTTGAFAITDKNGAYAISVLNDTAIIAPVNLSGYQNISCSAYQNIKIVKSGGTFKDSSNLHIPVVCSSACHHLQVELSITPIRKCDTNNLIKLRFYNAGCNAVSGVSIKVEIDTNLIDSILYPFTFVKNIDKVFFNLGTLNPFAEGLIEFKLRLKCSMPEGVSNCIKATITPNSTCVPAVNYDNSALSIKASCNKDSIIATISNNSGFDMTEPAKIVIYEDIIVQLSDTVAIKNNQSKTYRWLLNPNTTATVIVSQNTNHPAQPVLISHNEICALKSNSKSNSIIANFSRYDDRAGYDEECVVIDESMAPIQKTAIPSGFTINHYTPRNSKFEYRLDFKNLTSDTIKQIIIIDTLDPALDIQSFIPLNASHNYTIKIINNNILVFEFNNIFLPDSNHAPNNFKGYVKFYIVPRNLPAKNTVIKNKYSIVFDNQTTKSSNEVVNVMLDTIFVKSGLNQIVPLKINARLYPNPTQTVVFIELENYLLNGKLTIIDMLGHIILEQNGLIGNKLRIHLDALKLGNYILQISEREKLFITKPLIIRP